MRANEIVHWSQLDRGGHFAAMDAAEPEFPDQLVGRPAGDPHPVLVDAEEMMSGAEAEQVRLVVVAAMRPILDVMHVRGGPAAARNLTAVAVAKEDPLPLRHALLELLLPDGSEVPSQLHQAHSQ